MMSTRTFSYWASGFALTITIMIVGACGKDATSGLLEQPVQRRGSIEVITTTTGSDMPANGYSVRVVGGAVRSAGLNDRVTITDVRDGSYTIVLSGLGDNCVVTGSNPASVTVSSAQITTVNFAVRCVSPGRIPIVITSTSGSDPDPDGYVLDVKREGITTPLALPTNGTIRTIALLVGKSTVTLKSVAENCAVRAGAVRQVEATEDATLTVNFDIACTPVTQLAFVRENGSPEIYRVNSNGTGLVRLALGDQPAWSPDGKRIAFTNFRGEHNDIYIMNADGSNIVQRTMAGYNTHPAWSPDGRSLVFTSSRENPRPGVYVMSADGGAAVRLTSDPTWDSQPTWSPDGRKIAFIEGGDLYVMNSDGAERALVAHAAGQPFYYYSAPAWSPDGRTIAIFACPARPDPFDGCSGGSIALVNPDGSVKVLVTGDEHSKPAWSSDGRTIAFSTGTCSVRDCEPFLSYVRLDGSHTDVILPNGSKPAWRPL